MSRLLAEAVPLDNSLLISSEEEYDRLAVHIVTLFEKSTDLLTLNLDTLDPAAQTIPFLFILNANVDASLNNGKSVGRQLPQSVLPEGVLWPNITRVLLQFDPIQVRYAGRQLIKIVDIVAKGAEQTQNLVPAIQLLGSVILRLDPASSTLTTVHYQYIRICLLAQAYADAATILDFPICTIPSTETAKQLGSRAYKYLCSIHDSSSVYLTPGNGLTQKITNRIYLEYFLMGGMCYTAMGEYQKALFFYEVVLVAPTVQNVASLIMVEAYRKWLLVQLILNGKDRSLPKGMSSNAIKIVRPLAKPYECLVEAFKNNKAGRLEAEIQEGIDIWQADGNYGLVHEVLMASKRFAIQGLGNIYAALTIEELTHRLSADPSDVNGMLSYVQALIASGQLQAEIVPPTSESVGTLRFGNGPSNQLSETEVEAELATKTQELRSLMKQISDYDYQISISKDYVDWLQKLKSARDKEKTKTGLANRPIGVDMQDEDMMDDL